MKITWFGHSAIRIETGGSVILIDPFLTGNPQFTGDVQAAIQGCTHVALTHGHADHVGDTVDICKQTGATLIAVFELCSWLNAKGVEKYEPGNPGGTIRQPGFSVTFTKAFHSSSADIEDGRYLGAAAGLIIEAEGKTLYHMGDTEIFGDMALIQELYNPQVGFVPIGDRFTMGAKQAAFACKKFFRFETIVPVHYATFPMIDATPDAFLAEMHGHAVFVPEIGRSFDV